MTFTPQNLLIASLLLPLAGAVLIWLLGALGARLARWIALGSVLLTLAAAGAVVFGAAPGTAGPGVSFDWLGKASGVDTQLSFGIDSLNLWLYGLSALLGLTCVLISWEAIQERPASFYSLLLLLIAGLLGAFTARDLLLFYIFFEFTLIPLFFLIGVWGSEERAYAAMKFLLFTLAGSLLTLLGLLTIVLHHYHQTGLVTFSIAKLTAGPAMPFVLQCWVFAALFAGFAVKVPLFPLHTWLPLAHTQAPAAGSVLLAGVLLKIGTYAFLRFNLPMTPAATAFFLPALLWLSVAGIVYGALVALAQSDMKKLIAYSSVSHLGFCMLGLFALTPLGVQGGVLQAINHGLSTGGLFAIVGMIYERYHTREISALGGLARRTPWLAFFMLLFTFSSIGLPGLNGFAGEILLLTGMFQRAWMTTGLHGLAFKVIAVLAVSGVVLGAWYMLALVQRVFFGPLHETHHGYEEPPVADLSLREIGALCPLAVFVVWIGICPGFFLERLRGDLDPLVQPALTAWQEREHVDHAPTRMADRPGTVPIFAQANEGTTKALHGQKGDGPPDAAAVVPEGHLRLARQFTAGFGGVETMTRSAGTTDGGAELPSSSVPSGRAKNLGNAHPALNRGAIIVSPSGTGGTLAIPHDRR